MKASERLAARDRAWNFALIALAFASTIASIGLLVDDRMYGPRGNTVLVAVSVLSLVTSLVVANANYGQRAQAMDRTYKAIQVLSLKAEAFDAVEGTSVPRYDELAREYATVIANSENHATVDYALACPDCDVSYRNWHIVKEGILTAFPYVTIVLPIGILVPFASWASGGI